MVRRSHIAVKLARNASPRDLTQKLATSSGATAGKETSIEVPLRESSARLEVYNLKTLPLELRKWIWDLFVRNMQSLYESSEDGWNPDEKRKELFHSESRFFILRSLETGPTVTEKKKQEEGFLGYTVFRFDTEDTAGEEEADVVYCYELQVEPDAAGRGVGRVLMDTLDRIGRETKMDKTMLTVFKANEPAVAFYEKIGFTIDEIDPSNYNEQADYKILSRLY
ncbi:GNAT family N-acetyltransferase [Sporobolomyces salmoneus]|uniref:GNAT family N-acetyltransferase n=1 Tax=Sporobolomyces salmoneus TaxID=183962 RepID=UPI00316EEE8B